MKYIALLSTLLSVVVAFPSHGSLAGLHRRQLDALIPTLQLREPESPPGPLSDSSTKLVNDEAHPWKPLQPSDIRGPCPGLNTLASHGVGASLSLELHHLINRHFIVPPKKWHCNSCSDHQCGPGRSRAFFNKFNLVITWVSRLQHGKYGCHLRNIHVTFGGW